MPLKHRFNRLGLSAIWALCTGWRVRRSCSCQYINGSNVFSPLGPPRRHGHLRQVLAHRLPPQVDQGRRCGKLLADLVQVSFFIGSPLVSGNVSIASEASLQLLPASPDVERLRVGRRQGMQDVRHIGEVLPPGTAHLLPVMDRGCQDHYPALGLGDLGRICLDAFLQFLQALPCSRSRLACRRRPKMQANIPHMVRD